MLCENRFPLPGSPSTCTLDAGIIPFPSFLILLAGLVYVLVQWRFQTNQYGGGKAPDSVLPKWIHFTYVALVGALFCMRLLEIARLAAAHEGVGLLPFGLIANVEIIAMLCYNANPMFGMGRVRCVRISLMLVFYWFLSTILEGIKVARLTTLNNLNPAKGTPYPSSDYLLDNAVMLGLYIVFLLIEGAHLVLVYRHSFIINQQPMARELSHREIGKPLLAYPSSDFSRL